jgi:hypothetical protein
MSESDSKAAKSERHSSLDKSRGETEEVLSEDEGDRRDLWNYCMSQYLDYEELSKLPTPTTGVVAMYNRLAGRS